MYFVRTKMAFSLILPSRSTQMSFYTYFVKTKTGGGKREEDDHGVVLFVAIGAFTL